MAAGDKPDPTLSDLINKGQPPTAAQSAKLHEKSDKDGSPKAQHHTLGPSANQAAAGNHSHDGGNSAVLDKLMDGMIITGSRGGNAALTSLLSVLSSKFGLTDSTTP